MQGTQSQTRSIEDVVKLIEEGKLLLPEFQRDFKWPIEKSETLFDSLFQDLFIGSLIVSKPKFDLACKKFDERPRGSRGLRKPKPKLFTQKDFEDKDIYTLLDGQQRITSMFRALKGIDEIYLVLKGIEELKDQRVFNRDTNQVVGTYYDLIEGFDSVKPREKTFYITISNLYWACVRHYRENKIEEDFLAPRFAESSFSEDERELLKEISHQLFKYFATDILKKSNLLSVQLLDMDIEKFCLYFERSNSQGLNLSFADIITAKVYTEFKLGRAIEDAKDKYPNEFNDKHVDGLVRYINFKANGEVTKTSILQKLTGAHFTEHWVTCVDDFVKVQQWLLGQNWIYNLSSVPYRTILLPVLSFYQNLPHKDFSQATPAQLSQLRLWFYSGFLDYRYGGARHGSTNVVLKKDLEAFENLAKKEEDISPDFWNEIRIEYSIDELIKLDSNTNAKGIGINYYLYSLNQFLNIENSAKVNYKSSPVEIHHFYPSNYLKNLKNNDYDKSDSILNKIQINKISNLKISDKSPSAYLKEMDKTNKELETSLKSHGIECYSELISGNMDGKFEEFIERRFEFIDRKLSTLKEELKFYQGKPGLT